MAATLQVWKELSEQMGLKGTELKGFSTEQQDLERYSRREIDSVSSKKSSMNLKKNRKKNSVDMK